MKQFSITTLGLFLMFIVPFNLKATESSAYDGWLGAWRLFNEENNEEVMRFSVWREGDKITGEFELLPTACLDNTKEYVMEFPSICPFEGSSGQFTEVELSFGGFAIAGPDPFLKNDVFVLSMASLDQKTISVNALLLDAGRLALLVRAEQVVHFTRKTEQAAAEVAHSAVSVGSIVSDLPEANTLIKPTQTTATGLITDSGEWMLHFYLPTGQRSQASGGVLDNISAISNLFSTHQFSDAFPSKSEIQQYKYLDHISLSSADDVLLTPYKMAPRLLSTKCVMMPASLQRALDRTADRHLAWFTGNSCEWSVISGQALATASNERKKELRILRPLNQLLEQDPVIAEFPDGKQLMVLNQNAVTHYDFNENGKQVVSPLSQLALKAIKTGGALETNPVLKVPKIGKPLSLFFNPAYYTPGEYLGAAPGGFVLIGEEGFVALDVPKSLCDALWNQTGFAQSKGMCTEAKAFEFNQQRPKVTVLVHGLTSFPDRAIDQAVGKSTYAAYYWGYDFVQGIIGRTGVSNAPGISLITPNPNVGQSKVEDISFTEWRDCVDTVQSQNKRICRRNHVLAQQFDKAPVLMRSSPRPSYKAPYFEAVMIPNRDGTKALRAQMVDAALQICEAYQEHWGLLPIDRQPQLYFLGHSFGGIVTRAILSGVDPSNGPKSVSIENLDKWQSCQNLLRERTVSLTTLATPHQGSPATYFANESVDLVERLFSRILVYFEGLDTVNNPAEAMLADATMGKVKKDIEGIKEFLTLFISADRPAADDINSMDCLNGLSGNSGRCADFGLLAPEKLKRLDGTAIPVYTMSGRNPSGGYFNHPNQFADLLGFESTLFSAFTAGRRGEESVGLFLIDRLARMHENAYRKHQCKIWGTTEKGSIGDSFTMSHADTNHFCLIPNLSNADDVRLGTLFGSLFARVDNPFISVSMPNVDISSGQTSIDNDNLLVPRFGDYANMGGDGEYDSDGFVGFDSGHALALADLTGGDWYRIHENRGYGQRQPWDWDNHATETFNAGTAWWFYHVIKQTAGPTISSRALYSQWPETKTSPIRKREVAIAIQKVQVNGCEDIDFVVAKDPADLSFEIDVAGQTYQHNYPENSGSIDKPVLIVKEVTGPVVPIHLRFWDRDSVALNPRGKEGVAANVHDTCVITGLQGKSSLNLYLDLETGIVHGDRLAASQQRGKSGEYRYKMGKDFTIRGNVKTAQSALNLTLNINVVD